MDPADRLLDALLYVKTYIDRSLGVRQSCAHGVCGSDAMVINGVERLACKTLVQQALGMPQVPGRGDARVQLEGVRIPAGGSACVEPEPWMSSRPQAAHGGAAEREGAIITVEPLRHLPAQKDLMVDQARFFEEHRRVSPFFLPARDAEDGEMRQTPEERAAVDDPSKCILCAACYSACPVLDRNPDFIGPAALVQAARFVFDSREQGLAPRLDVLDQPNGVWSCENHFQCTRVCPRGIKVTKLINLLKQQIRRYREERGEPVHDGSSTAGSG